MPVMGALNNVEMHHVMDHPMLTPSKLEVGMIDLLYDNAQAPVKLTDASFVKVQTKVKQLMLMMSNVYNSCRTRCVSICPSSWPLSLSWLGSKEVLLRINRHRLIALIDIHSVYGQGNPFVCSQMELY